MERLIHWIFTLSLAFLMACSSGKSDLESGNYEEAVAKSVNKLRSNGNNKNARQTLSRAYPLAVKYFETQNANLESTNRAFKYEQILVNYRKLNAMYEDILRCPACMSLVSSPKDYLTEVESTKNKAAEERYQAGITALSLNDRLKAQEAYRHFQKAESFMGSNFKDILAQKERALSMATIKVVVEKVPEFIPNTDISAQFFSNKIAEYFARNQNVSEFIRFFTPQQLGTPELDKPNHVVRMQFENFIIGQERLSENVETITRDSVIIGQVEVDGAMRDVYGTVNAKLFRYQKIVPISTVLGMRIIDTQTSAPVLQETLPNQYEWKSEWAIFQGDERALTAEQLRLTQVKEERIPLKQDLFLEASEPIFNEATSRIMNYYRRLR